MKSTAAARSTFPRTGWRRCPGLRDACGNHTLHETRRGIGRLRPLAGNLTGAGDKAAPLLPPPAKHGTPAPGTAERSGGRGPVYLRPGGPGCDGPRHPQGRGRGPSGGTSWPDPGTGDDHWRQRQTIWVCCAMAGTAVVMANGSDEAKALADRLTDTNDNDGVAQVLNSLPGVETAVRWN